jgi:HSP20 family protein
MSQAARRSGTPSGTAMARYEPFNEFNRLAQQLSQLFDDQWPELPSVLGREGFSPPADVEETDDAYLIELDLPGVDKGDIDIEATGRTLVVRGERKENERLGLLRRQTRTVGRFRYEVMLPEQADGDAIDASLQEGVLRLRVPKQRTQQRRRIEVK